MDTLTERLQSLSPEQRVLFELHLKEKKLKIPALEIPRVPRGGDLPLSFAQQRFWLLQHLSPESHLYNTYLPISLTGTLNIQALERSVHEIVRRHEVLHTTFPVENGQPVQRPDPALKTEFRILDLQHESDAVKDGRAREVLLREIRTPFDLQRELPLRVLLVLLEPNEQILLVTMHHAVSDRWSIDVLASELGEVYEAHLQKRRPKLAELSIQYADFAIWQRQRMQGELLQRHLSHWKDRLQGIPPLDLPADNARPDHASSALSVLSDGSRAYLSLEPRLVENLTQIGQRAGATLFMTMLALFETLIFRYTGADDFAIGTPVTDRSNPETKNLIGCFINTLVLRCNLSGNPGFYELLQRVKKTCLDAYTWQDLPFERLVEDLQPRRHASYSPLFRVICTLNDVHEPLHGRNLLETTLNSSGLQLRPFEIDNGAVAADLILRIERLKTATVCALEYRTQLFRQTTIERMLGHFKMLLETVSEDPFQRIGSMPLLTEAERRQVLIDWNRTGTPYPGRVPVHRLFEDQAGLSPDAVALEFDDRKLTYRELNERANRLAAHLRRLGIGPEDRVAICLSRSPELIISLLATLKAGGAYLPLDAGYPKERLAFMLADAGARLLVTTASLLERLPVRTKEVICLDSDSPAVGGHDRDNLEVEVLADNAAYVIYTSGSTGTPKGVAVTHQNVVRLVRGNRFAEMEPEEVFFQLAPVSFDASTFEIWGALLNGARLVICPVQEPSLSELGEILRRERVTTLWLTAGLFRLMVDEQLESLSGLRQLLAGGDVLPVEHVRRVVEKLDCRLINGYGPTENTTFSCCHTVSEEDRERGSIAIGRPIANGEAYVLDESLEPVAVGVIGELYVGGDGLARGYVGRPELTGERFVPNPYGESEGERLYRTGDRARYREHGELEFAGRKDGQVKIRGYRVEPGEIEAALMGHGGVKEAVAVAAEGRGVEGEKRIVAYVVPEEAERVSEGELREYLRGRLPEYMLPGGWVMVDELPLTANGKVDVEALKRCEGEREGEEEEYLAPRSEIERKVAEIWEELLGRKRIGIHANFFDLGGHSLLAAQMASRLQQAFAVRVPLRLLFDAPTIAELAEDLEVLLWMVESGEALPLTTVKTETDDPARLN